MNQSDLEMLTSRTAIKYYLEDTLKATIDNTLVALSEIVYVKETSNLDAVGWLDDHSDTWKDTIIRMLELIEGDFVTIQSLIGSIFNSIDEPAETKLAIGEMFVEALLSNEDINIQYSREIRIISSNINKDLPEELGYILPNITPVRAKNNKTKYGTFSESVITGGSLKQHNGELCLDHINRMNQTEFSLVPELGQLVDMVFDPTPKFTDLGELETPEEVAKREKQFNNIKSELAQKCASLLQYCTRFSFGHKYCTRGRTMLKAYHFNYQSLKFIRGLIQFADGEVVKPDFGEE